MLLSVIRRSITRTTLHRFYVSLAANNYNLSTYQHRSKNSTLQSITSKHNVVSRRHIFNTRNEETKFLPLLPGYMHKSTTVMNILSMIFLRFTTLRLLDPEFTITGYTQIMKDAACKVSKELANENYEALDGLVDETTLNLLKNKIHFLSEEQKSLIAIDSEDIITYSPASIKVTQAELSNDAKSYAVRVEVTILIDYMPGYSTIKKMIFQEHIEAPNIERKQDLVANYVFVKDYTEDGGSDWTIGYVNLDVKPLYAY